MITTTTELNLRPEPNTSKAPILLIPSGAAVSLDGTAWNGWYPVVYNGRTGWVDGDYLTGLPEPETPTPTLWQPTNAQLLYDYALHFVGVRYDWGGAIAVLGAEEMDCSGFVTVMGRSQDIIGESERRSAQGYYDKWKGSKVERADVRIGDLIFYGSSTSNTGHVMMALNGDLCIGAQGGGQSTETLADAVATDGYVRTRKIDYRADRVAIVRPPWPFHS